MSVDNGPQQPWNIADALRPLGLWPEKNANDLLPFFHILERLKTTKRTGWTRYGINDGESIADHSWRMAMMAVFMAPAGLDRLKCLQMCLVHDIAESVVGDITPADNVSKEEKQRRERETVDWMARALLCNTGDGHHGEELRDTWEEFEQGDTAESRFVQNIDKLELLLQMVEYEDRGAQNLGQFAYVAQKLSADLKPMGEKILGERQVVLPAEVKQMQDNYYS